MGKKNKSDLGRTLIKDRFGKRGRKHGNSMLHTTELNDGYDWGRLNLQSVTEESSFQEFLSTAQLAGTEFQAEKLNIQFVNPAVGVGLLSPEEKLKIEEIHEKFKDVLKIPRRPKWDKSTTAEDLDLLEREEFLEWRRSLASLQEKENILLTPYEKNLEFWRQLWRVVERSDVVVQILDARNPLMFRCRDLEKYVKEVKSNKINAFLLNKADFLTRKQRKIWAKYFDSIGIRVAFFSAVLAFENNIEEESESESEQEEEEEVITEGNDSEYETEEEEEIIGSELEDSSPEIKNSPKLLGRDELISFFKSLPENTSNSKYPGVVTVGLVGYPNVGKSSTINAIVQQKMTSVSATPGKTKHFQTLFVDEKLMLCDCPGLVMPSFVSSKAEMIINGILPIDQMRGHVPPINLVLSLIPRHVLQAQYGIMIPKPIEGEDPDRVPTAEELLNAYGYSRGFMTQNGQPDNPRSSRYILKDYVNGKLLYCHAPPGVSQEKFHMFTVKQRARIPENTPIAQRAISTVKVTSQEFDKKFFKDRSMSAHSKGIKKYGPTTGLLTDIKRDIAESTASLSTVTQGGEKPWKNHKEKRNKREKLRRVYRYLDQ